MKKFFSGVVIFLKRLWEKFQADRCFVRASGLSFNTLLALVPFSALLFYLLSAFGVVESLVQDIQQTLVKQFLPARQQLIMEYISHFVTNARALGVIGLFTFLVTAVFLLNTIQGNFNDIWGSKAKAFSLRRVVAYISVLVVGSFLFSIGLNLTGMVKSLIGGTFNLTLNIVPLIVLFLSFLLIIQVLPSGKVDFISSLVGAVIGTILWEVAKKIFFLWTQYFFRMSVIYGSLAAIPILLLWLYVAWVIVLLAVEITYLYQHRKSIWFKRSFGAMSSSERLLIGLEVYLYIANKFYRGETAPTVEEISLKISMSVNDVLYFKFLFINNGLLISTGDRSLGLVPSRSLDKILLSDVVRSILGKVEVPEDMVREAKPVYEKVLNSIYGSVGDISVMEYLLGLEDRKDSFKGFSAEESKSDRGWLASVADYFSRMRARGIKKG